MRDRTTWLKIKERHPRINDDLALALAAKAMNDTVGPEGLVPTLLVFGVVPKIPVGSEENCGMNQKERFRAMATARAEWKS